MIEKVYLRDSSASLKLNDVYTDVFDWTIGSYDTTKNVINKNTQNRACSSIITLDHFTDTCNRILVLDAVAPECSIQFALICLNDKDKYVGRIPSGSTFSNLNGPVDILQYIKEYSAENTVTPFEKIIIYIKPQVNYNFNSENLSHPSEILEIRNVPTSIKSVPQRSTLQNYIESNPVLEANKLYIVDNNEDTITLISTTSDKQKDDMEDNNPSTSVSDQCSIRTEGTSLQYYYFDQANVDTSAQHKSGFYIAKNIQVPSDFENSYICHALIYFEPTVEKPTYNIVIPLLKQMSRTDTSGEPNAYTNFSEHWIYRFNPKYNGPLKLNKGWNLLSVKMNSSLMFKGTTDAPLKAYEAFHDTTADEHSQISGIAFYDNDTGSNNQPYKGEYRLGVAGVWFTRDNASVLFKVGDGKTHSNDLPFILPQQI